MSDGHIHTHHHDAPYVHVLYSGSGQGVVKQDRPVDRGQLHVEGRRGEAGLHRQLQLCHLDVAQDGRAGWIGAAGKAHGGFYLLQSLAGLVG